MKTLKELKGVKELSKTEQRTINGGVIIGKSCDQYHPCPSGQCCNNEPGICVAIGNGSHCW
jgi:hypothetical protein